MTKRQTISAPTDDIDPRADHRGGPVAAPVPSTPPARAADGPEVAPELGPLCPAEKPDRHGLSMLDQATKAHLARLTQGISPFGLTSSFFDWGMHLAASPGKQMQLADKAQRKAAKLAMAASRMALGKSGAPCIDPLIYDKRFVAPEWQRWPHNLIYQSFLMTQQWWYNATNDIDGLSRCDEQVVSFVMRQLLDRKSVV